MELTEMWTAIRRRLWIVLVMAIIAAGTAGSLAKWYLPKVYSASATLMVIPGPTSGTSYIDTLVAGQQMVSTYAALATNASVLKSATNAVLGAPSVAWLEKNTSASAESGTNLMTLTTKADSPRLAAQLSNAISATLVSTVSHVTGQPNLKLVTRATPDKTPVSPRLKRTTGEALALGIVLGMLIALIWNSLDDAIRNEDAITALLDCPVLGTISTVPPQQESKRRRARNVSPETNERSASS